MRQLCSTLLLAGITATALPSLAHDADDCLPMDATESLVCRHYFEGTSIDLPVRAILDRFGTACENLVVNVLQSQGLMLAELGDPQAFDAEQCAAMTSITLDLPDIRSEVDILVQFSAPDSKQAPEVIAVRVYPDTLLDPLSDFATRSSLVVFDEEGALTGFLDRNEIDYVHAFDRLPGVAVALLVQPAEAERLLEDRDFDAVVIFQEKVVDLPQIRAVSANGQTRVYVEMPLLHDLYNSPLAQKALLNIIRLATNPSSTDRG